MLERTRVFVHAETETEEDLQLLIEYVKSTPFKGKQLSIISAEYINSLLLYDISPLVQEEEIYEVLRDISKGLCSITMFDTATPHKVLSAGVCLLEYDDYLTARHGMLSIIQRHAELRGVFSPSFKVIWAEPLFDYSSEFALHSRVIEIKNVSLSCTTEFLYNLFKKYGEIQKIRRYSTSCIIYFTKVSEARAAYENLMEIELDSGITCKVSMAKLHIEEITEQTPDIKAVNLHDVNAMESMNLVQQLMYETSPISEMLLNKARSILKVEASKAASQQEQAMYDNIPIPTEAPTIPGKRPPEIERSTYQYKKIKVEDGGFGGGGFYDQRYAGPPPIYNSNPYQYRPNTGLVRSAPPEITANWEQRRTPPAGVPRSTGFAVTTREAFDRMSKEDRIKYVQQYYQMINSMGGQAYSRLPP